MGGLFLIKFLPVGVKAISLGPFYWDQGILGGLGKFFLLLFFQLFGEASINHYWVVVFPFGKAPFLLFKETFKGLISPLISFGQVLKGGRLKVIGLGGKVGQVNLNSPF